MDDGYSPVGILLLIGFILLEAAFYGFGSAIQNMDEDELEEEAGKGDAAAARMLRVIENPANLINTIQIMTHLVGMIMGAIFIPVLIVRMGAGRPCIGNQPGYINPGRMFWSSDSKTYGGGQSKGLGVPRSAGGDLHGRSFSASVQTGSGSFRGGSGPV